MQKVSAEFLSRDTYAHDISNILLEIYSAIKPEHCFIARIGSMDAEISLTQVSTISYLIAGAEADNTKYRLTGTPCDNVIHTNAELCITKNVQHLFPLDIMLKDLEIEGYIGIPLWDENNQIAGIFVCLFQRMLNNPSELISYCKSRLQSSFNKLSSHLPTKTDPSNLLSASLFTKYSKRIASFTFDHITDAIMITDVNNTIVAVNKTMLKMTGYFEHELLSHNPRNRYGAA